MVRQARVHWDAFSLRDANSLRLDLDRAASRALPNPRSAPSLRTTPDPAAADPDGGPFAVNGEPADAIPPQRTDSLPPDRSRPFPATEGHPAPHPTPERDWSQRSRPAVRRRWSNLQTLQDDAGARRPLSILIPLAWWQRLQRFAADEQLPMTELCRRWLRERLLDRAPHATQAGDWPTGEGPLDSTGAGQRTGQARGEHTDPTSPSTSSRGAPGARRPRYPSDLTERQWARVRQIPQLDLADRLTVECLQAIQYRWTTGCSWRMLPHDFPAWRTVYRQYRAWQQSGQLRQIREALLVRCRGG